VRPFRLVIAAALSGVSLPALAQQADVQLAPAPTPAEVSEAAPADATSATQPPTEAVTDDEVLDGEETEIVVTGQRQRGEVLGDIPPEITLNPREIRALGTSNVAELLQVLAPQTGSSRGRGGGGPVVLVNGRRISSFSEIRDLPPEAIQRVDILPEEVALRYGYRADQRVVNLVLRERFRAVTAEVEGGVATAGGRGNAEIDVNYLQIVGPTRTSFDVEYQNQAALLESEREIIQLTPVSPNGLDSGDFRTLLPSSSTFQASGQHSRQLFGNVGATIDGRFVVTQNQSLLGLPQDDLTSRRALTRESDSWNGHLGFSANGDLAPWRWNLTANFDRNETDSVTERLALAPADTAETINQAFTTNLVANGPLLDAWAGPISASLSVQGELRSFDSESTRSGVFRETSLSRQRIEGQASFDMPITSTREGVLDAIGDLSVNLNLNAEQLSDFGTLTTIGYGLNWRPTDWLSFIASATHEEGAPSITQLGDPVIATPNVRVFDFRRGETVDITRIDGGNPDLLADSRRVINLGLNVRPLENLSIRANYTDSRITNPIAGFPAATAEIEAAFPDRFVRDAGGRLVSIDTRPINFSESRRRDFRWGIDFSAPFGPQRPQGGFGGFGGGRRGGQGRPGRPGAQGEGAAPTPPGQAAQGGEQPPAPGAGEGRRRGGGGFGGRGGFGGFGGGGGRMQFSLFHTWRLQDTVLIRPGVPELDFLAGSAAGNGGGTPQHQVEFRANLFRDGFGGRLEVDWQSGTRVSGAGGSDLEFSPRTNVNLRLFANLGQQRDLVREFRFLRGTRISLNINNLFDERVNVRDQFGTTPISYQPFLLDPVGRSVTISLRKQFF
jgi:hypothetical protein